MTNEVLLARPAPPGLATSLKQAIAAIAAWLNEPVAGAADDPLPQLSARDWADLPTHHPRAASGES